MLPLNMLTRRTNVLLTEEDYLNLSLLAKKQKKTIAALIREALRKTYRVSTKTDQSLSRKIKANWKHLKQPQKSIDYKKLVNYGRKY